MQHQNESDAATRPSARSRMRTVAVALMVAAVTVWAFSPAFQAEWLTWDDDVNFVENEAWRGLSPAHLRWMFTTFHQGPYQPLSWLTLGVDHALFGLDPRGFHVTNVLIQTGAAVAFFALARELFTAVRPGVRGTGLALDLAAAMAALAFAIHPLRCESVAWITERRDVLSGLFIVLCVLSYVRFTRESDARRKRTLFASIVFYVLSLLAKGLGMMLPPVLLVLDMFILSRWNGGWRRPRTADGRRSLLELLREKVPFLIPAAIALVLAWIGQRQQPGLVLSVEQHGIVPRVAQSFFGLYFYASKTLWPSDLVALVPLRRPLDPSEPRFVVAIIVVLAAAALLWWSRRRVPALVGAVLAYVIFLAPILGLTQAGPQLVADRYSYLSCLSFALLFGGIAHRVLIGRPAWTPLVTLAGGSIVAVLAIACHRQTHVWHDPVSLWTKTCDVQPDNPAAFRNLVVAYMRAAEMAEDPARKIELYGRGLAECARGTKYEVDAGLLSNASAIHCSLADLEPARAREHLEMALDHGRRAIELGLRVDKPVNAAYLNHALAAIRLERPEEAVGSFAWLADHEPDDPGKLLMLGQALSLAQRPRDALVPLELAQTRAPDSPLVWMESGTAHKALGEIEAAVRCFERGIALAEAEGPAGATTAEELAMWKALLTSMRP